MNSPSQQSDDVTLANLEAAAVAAQTHATTTRNEPMSVQIRTQRTPNPNAWKFILSKDVKTDGKVSYTGSEECEHVPLAAGILELANVTQVHFFENVITVTQNGASDWQVLSHAVQEKIQALIDSHDPEFVSETTKKKAADRSLFSADLAQIDEILERTVRPGLQADGGDLEVIELDGNVLSIRYEGACGGCPSAAAGTLEAIKGILRHEFSPDLEVVAI